MWKFIITWTVLISHELPCDPNSFDDYGRPINCDQKTFQFLEHKHKKEFLDKDMAWYFLEQLDRETELDSIREKTDHLIINTQIDSTYVQQ